LLGVCCADRVCACSLVLQEIMTLFEMKLLLEQDRWEDLAKSSLGTTNQTSAHASSPGTTNPTSGHANGGTDTDGQGHASRKRSPLLLTEPRDQTTDNRKKQRAVQETAVRTYSERKIVGARCYARKSRKQYSWGSITKVTGSSNEGRGRDDRRDERVFSVSATVCLTERVSISLTTHRPRSPDCFR
jgi:hypothetical protein